MRASVDEDDVLSLELRALQVPPTAQLRGWIRTRLPGLSEEARYDLQLVCTELIANAYEHGAMPGEVRIGPAGTGRIRVEVDDSSPELPAMRRFPPDSYRGRGLRMVDRLSRCWGVRCTATGKTVWAEVAAPTRSGIPAPARLSA